MLIPLQQCWAACLPGFLQPSVIQEVLQGFCMMTRSFLYAPDYFRGTLPLTAVQTYRLSWESAMVSTRRWSWIGTFWQNPQSSLALGVLVAVLLRTFFFLLLHSLAEHPSSAAALEAARQLLLHICLLQAGSCLCNRPGLESLSPKSPTSLHIWCWRLTAGKQGWGSHKHATARGVTAAAISAAKGEQLNWAVSCQKTCSLSGTTCKAEKQQPPG